MTNEVPKDPDSLEHVDAVEEDDHHTVLADVEDQGGDDLEVPVKTHHEEQPSIHH